MAPGQILRAKYLTVFLKYEQNFPNVTQFWRCYTNTPYAWVLGLLWKKEKKTETQLSSRIGEKYTSLLFFIAISVLHTFQLSVTF